MTRRWLVWSVGGLAVSFLAAATLRAGLPLAAQGSSGQDVSVPAEQATLNRYCAGCHNRTVNAAGLALDALRPDRPGDNPEEWEKVVRKLRGRMMPPAGRPRP